MCRVFGIICSCGDIPQAASSLPGNVTQCNTKPSRGTSSGTEAVQPYSQDTSNPWQVCATLHKPMLELNCFQTWFMQSPHGATLYNGVLLPWGSPRASLLSSHL